jgi:hypothetical protein
MNARTQGEEQSRGQRFFGEDFKAWLRQGLNELREIFNPSKESIAQPLQYGAIGQPPPGLISKALTDQNQQQTFSLDQLKERGREILRDQEHDNGRDQDHGNEHGR